MKVLCFLLWAVGISVYVVWHCDRKDMGRTVPAWLDVLVVVFYVMMACYIESWC